jgi:hypothetical protein
VSLRIVSISLPLFEIYPPPMLMRTVSCCVRARGAAWEFFLWFRGKGPQGPVYYTRPTAMSFTSPPQALSYVVFTRPAPAPSPKVIDGPAPNVVAPLRVVPCPACCHFHRISRPSRETRRACQPKVAHRLPGSTIGDAGQVLAQPRKPRRGRSPRGALERP